MNIKVRITKLSNCESPRNPDNIEDGFTTTGFMYDYPKERDFFYLGNFRSSRVISLRIISSKSITIFIYIFKFINRILCFKRS